VKVVNFTIKNPFKAHKEQIQEKIKQESLASASNLASASTAFSLPASSSQEEGMFWDYVDACRSSVTQREMAKAVIAESIRKLSSEKLRNLWKPHASEVLNMLMEHPQSLKVA
jgi:hypothetical protein